MSPQPEFFLDTAFAIALASRKDAYHQTALELAGNLKESRARLVTAKHFGCFRAGRTKSGVLRTACPLW